MNNNINEEKLQELGIYEIRNIARDVGVYSPTLFKKQELIDKIMKIINGEEQPHIKKTKQGRPPKNIFSLNNFVDVFMPGNLVEEKPVKEELFIFNDDNENINVDDYSNNEIAFSGLVKVYKDYALAFKDKFIEDKNTILINSKQVEVYNLKTGDFITGKAVFVNEDKPYILKEIHNINSSPFVKNYERSEDFLEKVAITATAKLKTDIYKFNEPIFQELDLRAPLAKGQRILFKGQPNFSFDILHKLSTDVNNLKGVAILIDEAPENYFETKGNSNLYCISNNFNNNGNVELEIEVQVQSLLRLVELGDDVILYINSIENLYNFIVSQKVLNKISKDEAQVLAKNYISNLILLGKNTNSGSLTVLFNCKENNNEYDNLFNNIVYFYEDNFEVKINTKLSKTQNLDKILSKSEFVKLKNLTN